MPISTFPAPTFERAIGALTAEGFRKSPTALSPRWERRFARACELRSPDGVELDLHAAVATGYFGAVLDHDRLRTAPDHVSLGGEVVPVFSLPGRALISCYGVVLSRGPGLRLRRDLVQQFDRIGDRWGEVVELGGAAGGAVIAEATATLAATFGPGRVRSDLAAWASTLEPDRRARRALELAQQGVTSGWSADARSAMMALGVHDRLRFGTGVAAARVRRELRRRRAVTTGS